MLRAFALSLCLLIPINAWASCDGKEAIFTEDFSDPDPTWSVGSSDKAVLAIENKKYVMKLKPGAFWADWPTSFLYSGNYKICVTMQLPDEPLAAGSGLVFWVNPKKDAGGNVDNYQFLLGPDGSYVLSRQVNGQDSNVIPMKQDPSLKAEKDKPYELELTITGNAAELAVNGKQLLKFKGQPPPNSYAGFIGSAPADKDWKVEFSDFKVVK